VGVPRFDSNWICEVGLGGTPRDLDLKLVISKNGPLLLIGLGLKVPA